MHSRSEWTTRQPAWSPARRGVPDVFVHHEGGAVRGVPGDKAAVLREIEQGVLGKGYIAIDYNVMVFNDGDIWEGRGLAREDGATIHNNPTSVSICAVGNYEREPAPDALIHGIAAAVQIAASTGWTVPHPNIRPHRDVFATACPGAHLFARMNDIRALASGAPVPGEDDMFEDTDRALLYDLHHAVFGEGSVHSLIQDLHAALDQIDRPTQKDVADLKVKVVAIQAKLGA